MRILKLKFNRNATNYHGPEYCGWPWHPDTIHGWKLRLARLSVYSIRLEGLRLILYFPSGAWWNFDVYLMERKTRDNSWV